MKFGMEKRTYGPLLHAKFYLDRFNVSPLRGEKPKIGPWVKTIPAELPAADPAGKKDLEHLSLGKRMNYRVFCVLRLQHIKSEQWKVIEFVCIMYNSGQLYFQLHLNLLFYVLLFLFMIVFCCIFGVLNDDDDDDYYCDCDNDDDDSHHVWCNLKCRNRVSLFPMTLVLPTHISLFLYVKHGYTRIVILIKLQRYGKSSISIMSSILTAVLTLCVVWLHAKLIDCVLVVYSYGPLSACIACCWFLLFIRCECHSKMFLLAKYLSSRKLRRRNNFVSKITFISFNFQVKTVNRKSQVNILGLLWMLTRPTGS